MRKPLRTKNSWTPIQPRCKAATNGWVPLNVAIRLRLCGTTRRIAIARRPSRVGRRFGRETGCARFEELMDARGELYPRMTVRRRFVTLRQSRATIPVSLADKTPLPPLSPASEGFIHDRASPEMLRDLQALQGVGEEVLDALLPRARLARLQAGERLLLRGAPNLCVYVVISGLLRVELDDGNPPLARIGPGETVGELSLLSGSVTTATVAAEEPTQLLAL